MDRAYYEDRKRQLLWLAVHNRDHLSSAYRRTLVRQRPTAIVFATVHEMIRAVLKNEFPAYK